MVPYAENGGEMAAYLRAYVACGISKVNCNRINLTHMSGVFRGDSIFFVFNTCLIDPLVGLLYIIYCGADAIR